MNSEIRPAPWIDAAFIENQRRFSAEALARYQGQHIAWSWDGTQILAADADRRALDQKLREAGIDPLAVIHDFVEDPNLSCLCAAASDVAGLRRLSAILHVHFSW